MSKIDTSTRSIFVSVMPQLEPIPKVRCFRSSLSRGLTHSCSYEDHLNVLLSIILAPYQIISIRVSINSTVRVSA